MKTRVIYLIYGKTGSGKSTLAKKLIKNFSRICIIDALHEYNEGIIFYSLMDFTNYLKTYKYQKENFTYIFRFTNDNDINNLFVLIYELENICLLLEEAEIYISPYSKRSSFLKLVRYGRHKEISIIGIARRISELSTDFRAQVNKIYTFKQTDFNDLKKLESLGIYDADKLAEYEFKELQY